MSLWIPIAAIVLVLAVAAASRKATLRPRGLLLVGIALLLAVGIELLIQTDTISVGFGSQLMGIALILLAAWAIWKLPRSRSGNG